MERCSSTAADGRYAWCMSVRRALFEPPSDAHGAAWVLAVLIGSGGLYGLILSVAVPEFAGGAVTSAIVVFVVCIACSLAMLRFRDHIPPRWWVIAPFLAVAAVVSSNIATSDATTGSQLFLLWPGLYAALYLNLPQTVAVVVTAMAGEAAVVLTILPGWRGVTDLTGMMLAAVMTALVIRQLRHRVGLLVRALEAQALEDQLTGLPNRRALEMAVSSALLRYERHGEPVTLLTLDLDRFKEINDRLGHSGGDRALREVARCLRGSLRAVDTVARLGGDEFVVLLPGCDRGSAPGVADKLRATVAEAVPGVTVSVGTATVSETMRDADALYRASDAALYAAKNGGRNRVTAAA